MIIWSQNAMIVSWCMYGVTHKIQDYALNILRYYV